MDWMNPRGGWAPPRRSAPPALGLSCPRSRGRCGSARRAGFRFLWGNPWGFESPLPHQPQNPCFQGLACEHTETGASRHVIWHHGFGNRRGTRRGTRLAAFDIAKRGPRAGLPQGGTPCGFERPRVRASMRTARKSHDDRSVPSRAPERRLLVRRRLPQPGLQRSYPLPPLPRQHDPPPSRGQRSPVLQPVATHVLGGLVVTEVREGGLQ